MHAETAQLAHKILTAVHDTRCLVFGMKGRSIQQVYHEGLTTSGHLKRTVYYLYQKGYIRWRDKDGKRFITLTRQGKVRILLSTFGVVQVGQWDKKWRVLVFDIPESAAHLRSLLVYHLRELSFVKLQASVYIGPYAFNAAAMEYLKTSGLLQYIRLLTVERLDDDADLRHRFDL